MLYIFIYHRQMVATESYQLLERIKLVHEILYDNSTPIGIHTNNDSELSCKLPMIFHHFKRSVKWYLNIYFPKKESITLQPDRIREQYYEDNVHSICKWLAERYVYMWNVFEKPVHGVTDIEKSIFQKLSEKGNSIGSSFYGYGRRPSKRFNDFYQGDDKHPVSKDIWDAGMEVSFSLNSPDDNNKGGHPRRRRRRTYHHQLMTKRKSRRTRRR